MKKTRFQLGPLTFGKKNRSIFLGTEYGKEKNYSEETARQIDAEVREIIQASHERSRILLEKHRPTLDALAAKLEEVETLSGEEVESIIGRRMM